MRFTEFGLTTLKEIPAEAEIVSHQLMLRAGLIRRLASGLFSWMPMGLRVMKKVERVVRQEMDRAGALEMVMPAVQPAELWQESGRWEQYGPLLLRMQDRHERHYCFGPTHERGRHHRPRRCVSRDRSSRRSPAALAARCAGP